MEDRTKSFLQAAFENRSGGSGEVLDQLMQGMVKASKEGYDWNESRLKKVVQECLEKLGHFAIVVHFLDRLLRSVDKDPSGKAVIELIQNYRKTWSGLHAAHARNLRSVQVVGNQTILLHSHSSSIVGLFEVLSRQTNLSETTLLQSISHPRREGLIQGERLAKQGWKVIFIEDAAMGKMLLQCHYAILGSDVLTKSTFVNKVGSMPIASVAQQLQKPIYVIGDERKLVNETNLSAGLSSKLMTELPKPENELGLNSGQTGLNYYFEHVPCDWVNGFVLSKGVYTPNELTGLVEEHAYSKVLLELASELN